MIPLQETGDEGMMKADSKRESAFLPEIRDTDYEKGCALSTDYSH
jgi:hypothetical protein